MATKRWSNPYAEILSFGVYGEWAVLTPTYRISFSGVSISSIARVHNVYSNESFSLQLHHTLPIDSLEPTGGPGREAMLFPNLFPWFSRGVPPSQK